MNKRATASLLITAVLVGPAGCGDASPDDGAGPVTVTLDRPASPVDVSARANIFGAGQAVPPAPGGGGPGVLPPEWRLPVGAGRALTFPEVTGSVNPIVNEADFVGPAGDGGRFGTTDVRSAGGISGIVDRGNGMFLVGVLLGDGTPPAQAPARLDVTGHDPSVEIAPEIGQTFAVGDGRAVRVRVPDSATRLFLGFADGFLYRGDPGWYDNNDGKLTVTVAATAG